MANGGIRAGNADVFAWGLRAGSIGAGSADLRAVGVQSLTTGPGGLAVGANDRLLVFAINTWQPWTAAAVNEFDILINPDSSGQPAYVVGALDHGVATSGTPDGTEGCFILRMSDLTLTEASFTSRAGEQHDRPLRRAGERHRRCRRRPDVRRRCRLAVVADHVPAARARDRSIRSSRRYRRATTSPSGPARAGTCRCGSIHPCSPLSRPSAG